MIDRILQIVALIGLSIGALLLRLGVLCKVWGYIAVPMGAHPITMLQAFGISAIVGLITAEYEPNKTEETAQVAGKKIVMHILQSLFSWAMCYWIFG